MIRLWKTTDWSSPKRDDCPHEYWPEAPEVRPERPEVRQVGNPETGELFCDVDDEDDEFNEEEAAAEEEDKDAEEEVEDEEVDEEVLDVKELQGRRAGRLAGDVPHREEEEEEKEVVVVAEEVFCFLHWVSTIRQASSSSSSDDIIRGVGGRYKSLNINPLSVTSSPHESALHSIQ